MARDLQNLRQFEADYYDNMPLQVRERAEMRNVGISRVWGAGNIQQAERGADILAQSVHGLRSAEGHYKREYFASLYMQARGEFLLGEHDYAAEIAAKAMEHVPEVPEEFHGGIIADQYVAIASGRLSLILSASFNGGFDISAWDDNDRRNAAIEAAQLARGTCRHSEDPNSMLFADGSMTEKKRQSVRRQHTLVAAAATAGLWLPYRTTLELAEKVCKKSK